MATKVYAGVTVEVTDQGYLVNPAAWTPEIAAEMAQEEGIPRLTEKHLALIMYLRDRAHRGEALSMRSIGKSGVADIKEFYQLFPGAPLRIASRLAGIAKPSSCV